MNRLFIWGCILATIAGLAMGIRDSMKVIGIPQNQWEALFMERRLYKLKHPKTITVTVTNRSLKITLPK